MPIKGRAFKFGKDVDTDQIIPARYLNTSDPDELARHCMEDADPEFIKKMAPGDLIVADKNFGCGSSREHAPIAIKAAGVSAVIAKSFARIFYRNAFNMGLLIFESGDAVNGISQGDEIEVEMESGRILNRTTGKTYQAAAIPPFMRELINAGGLMAFVKKKIRTGM
ncbi:MAG: 3-isopropylmalate dehydratase small subunit [Nitrospirae bacterium CG_4_9_14_3_um_filter_53_35]|nr:MAG: 3-isopropylmalate dehydratase small subunit [Nitrospirae bacterium CG2_30_53_67]PIS36275.1 MAG: 3-isopropylmalate dehydratase small subunit [Nitrospirae bacterium CG08_land_8_20_14_0_20_52_24]PIV82963.1 MAG: 3-isopropylmalate dehydratase small subunit [Nitrospirae bacterium CG17_big_fil_post_rev_8_21_14_2_50_50_9]PIW84702.1 MAG: 3-isopropylmalate dehydratase small subunit [Nitrospirae bacterium CG_4_8_14_3_um_filter_50_41]PIX86195.1 MAG: 3-isopropylmalate dehydratase small subunit [Nitr